MKLEKAKKYLKKALRDDLDYEKIVDKIYSDHKKEIKELKKRITELEWKCDSTRWGA